jgi:hypothetical protein
LLFIPFYLDRLRCGPRSLLREGLWVVVLILVSSLGFNFVGVELEQAVATGVAWVAAVVAKVVFLAMLLFLYK